MKTNMFHINLINTRQLAFFTGPAVGWGAIGAIHSFVFALQFHDRHLVCSVLMHGSGRHHSFRLTLPI
ncbi:unnamed protein product [Trifolium pratense]|uniref:Uncharacterized protein n=1 Tax=Trifolium pratense TaxID=57577 RepID=A0ACB0MDK3_TRIPR|nr:unnamed protein product [Trifolium pratense]